MSVFDNIEDVYSLIAEIIKLRNAVKCPICLDIISNPVQISCYHRFCSECINSFLNEKSTKLSCPVCRKSIKRQRQDPDNAFKQHVQFVMNVNKKLIDQFRCDISTLASLNKGSHTPNKNQQEMRQKSKEGLKKSIKMSSNKKILEEQLSTSNKEVEKDAFDILLESYAPNTNLKRSSNVKTYARKKEKPDSNGTLYQKLIDFEDDNYKLKIINWLCDNRNKFDRLTQTESIIDDDSVSSICSLDLPAISQEKKPISRLRKKNPVNMKRAKSLEIKVQQGSTLKSKRYSSFSGDSQKELDNVNIEEIDSDKDVLSIDQINKIQLLEEKCLNSIEVMLQDKENNNSENGKTKRRRRYKKQEENNQIKGVDPGWNRIQKMNKSLNKTNREMKKLRVSLTSSAKLDKKCNPTLVQAKCISDESKKVNVKPVVLLNRLSSEYELWKETKSDENSKSYNLREVESYIENNINTFENHEDSNSIRPGTSDRNAATTVASNKAELRPNQIIKDSQDINKSYEAACNSSEDSRSIHDKKQIAHSGSIFSQSKRVTVDPDDIFSLPTQKIFLDSKMDKVERELQAMFSSPETENQKSNVDNNNAIVNDINEISTVLDQLGKSIISFTDCLQDNIDVDIAKFSIDKLKLLLNNLKSKHNSQNVAPEYTKNVFITQPISLDTRSIAIQTNDFPSSGFKISSTADFKTLEKCNAEIQTDEISDEKYLKKLLKMSQDDTYLHSYVKTKSIAIQTEKSKSPKFECKSSKQSIAIQVEMVTNQDLVYIASDTSVSSRTPSDILVNNDEITDYCRDNFQFAESLDCVNFDTQAALQANKQKMETKADVNNAKYNTQSTRPIRKKLSFDTKQHFQDVVDTCSDSDVEIIENENTLVSKEDNVYVEEELKLQKDVITSAPNSTILFSLTQKDNAMNNTMINRFKRVRALMEDYDDGVIKKLKKQENPYLMPQLSVEFISQAPENVNEAQKELVIQNDTSQSIQISQSLNYDEYLDRIMEKYDENNIKTSTPKKEPVPKSRQTKSQYIINKCDALIQEAAVSPPVSPPKKKLCKEYDITTQDLEEFKLPFNEIISEPENFHKMAHKKTENHTESIFCRYGTNTQTTVLVDMPFSNMESLAEEFSKELQPMSAKSVSSNKSISDVKVLQNILLQKQDGVNTPELQYNLEDEWQKMEECTARGSQKSEEVFSDSDIDLIETTPQKKTCNDKLFLSESLQNRHSVSITTPIKFIPPEDSADVIFATNAATYLNKTFDPPTEFQDDNIDVPVTGSYTNLLSTNNFDTILPILDIEKVDEGSDLDETLTNVNIKRCTLSAKQKNVPQHTRLLTNDKTEITDQKDVTKQILHNQRNKHVDNISLKQRNVKDLNPIEIALKSNYTPLEIVPAKLQSKQMLNLCNLTPKKQESILRYMSNKTNPNEKSVKVSIQSANCIHEPRIACTRLSKDQFIAVSALTNRKLATYSNLFDSSVTHMIVSVNDKNCIHDHTMKFVSAVAAGIWVVSFKWIQECLSQNKIVQEEPYEALDVSGVPGPKIARLKIKPPLLKDFLIYVAASSLSVKKSDVEDVIHMLGGKTVSTLEALVGEFGIRLIISEAKVTQEFGMYETWLETLKVATVDIEWLSRSVGQYQLLSLKPFALCSDDNFADLGYPEELLVDTPFSFSQSIYNS